MTYYSLNNKAPETTFEQAVIRGLAPDKGLYFPKNIPLLPTDFFKNNSSITPVEIALEAIIPFVGEDIPKDVLEKIVEETLCFDFPYQELEKDLYVLELFHGPTMAFKDVGARFMARCLGYFNSQKNTRKVTVLVATSGDTGGAVADGFYGVDGVEVVILYPSGKVSNIQEKQLTTLGRNITALEVDGVFDDCQAMVKTAFMDPDLQTKNLTSANSINVARWLPQMFYYLIAHQAIGSMEEPLSFAVPSGNFGNICAGMIAHQMGMPIKQFISATNINDTVPRYMTSGKYEPRASKQTISNAMDVGDPSNFVRIQQLFDNNFEHLKNHFSAVSYTDAQTRDAIDSLYKSTGYIADPHGAIGYLAAKKYQKTHDNRIVFLETAHPAKFLNTVQDILQIKIDIPQSLQEVLSKPKVSKNIQSYDELKQYLID